jgi:hypothetical protein
MVTKDELYRLIDGLPERELPTARRFLQFLRSQVTLPRVLSEAPEDGEPLTDEDRAAIAEGAADIAAGRVVTLEEIKREFGR